MFSALIDPDTGCLRQDHELGKIFTQADVDTTRTTVCSCGSGLSACVVALGLNVLGNEKTVIYDGSWAEYVSVC